MFHFLKVLKELIALKDCKYFTDNIYKPTQKSELSPQLH